MASSALEKRAVGAVLDGMVRGDRAEPHWTAGLALLDAALRGNLLCRCALSVSWEMGVGVVVGPGTLLPP